MSDSVKKYFEDNPPGVGHFANNAIHMASTARKFLWVLDFEQGRVFMYNIRREDLESEDYEDLLTLKGHNIGNCDWMVCESGEIYN